MPYDGKILSRAMARPSEDKQRRTQQFRERQQRLFCREPELADIDRRLRGTMSQIISRALRQGKDPVPAIHAIRDENLALQRRRGELLEAMGYPAIIWRKKRCAVRPQASGPTGPCAPVCEATTPGSRSPSCPTCWISALRALIPSS